MDGDVLVVHSSLSAVGWVAGGATAVVDALLNAVGPQGTVTMPAHSGDWSDPAGWSYPPVPEEWWNTVLQQRPAFDPYATTLRQMGAVAENLLLRRSTLRSMHPVSAHMANGRRAQEIIAEHSLEESFGDRSPLGRLYDLDARVLLIGVGHGRNTSLHLAESRASWPGKVLSQQRSTVLVDGAPGVVTWMAHGSDDDDFEALGEVLDASGAVAFGHFGHAETRVARMRDLVDAAVPWFEQHRGS
jgi:aminoglycoside 3-N-acetyltransferase